MTLSVFRSAATAADRLYSIQFHCPSLTWPPWDVAVSGDRAYVADESSGLLIFDISEPASLAQ